MSYSHSDGTFAQRLAGDLDGRGLDVWIDRWELAAGDSLLTRISGAIEEIECVLAIISRTSLESRWVALELEMAMNRQLDGEGVRVVPLMVSDCTLPLFLRGRLYVDFRDGSKYRIRLRELCQALGLEDRGVALTAREAARRIKHRVKRRGGLFALSQQGVIQQYLPAMIMHSHDWQIADAKTGRSRAWVANYYDAPAKVIRCFGIYDGEVTTFPELKNLGEEPRVLLYPFCDSDVAVAAGLWALRQELGTAFPDDDDYFVLAQLFPSEGSHRWWVQMYDVVSAHVTQAVLVHPDTGEVDRIMDPPCGE